MEARLSDGLILHRVLWLLFALWIIHGTMANSQLPQAFMPPSSSVVELNLWTIRGSIADGRLWFIMFYVPWCRGCKRMSGQWDALGDAFRNCHDTVIARFDCMQAEEDCEGLGVDRTPTLKLFLNGAAMETYRADFYHLDMMKPFLQRMRAKYTVPPAPGEAANNREGDDIGRQVGDQEDPGRAGEMSARPSAQTPVNAPHDTRAPVDDSSSLPYDNGSGIIEEGPGPGGVTDDDQSAERSQDDLVQATPVQPGVYDRPAGEERSIHGDEGGGTHGTARPSDAEFETGTEDVGMSGSETVEREATPRRISLEATAAASSGMDEVPLTQRGRQGGLAVEMLQKDKEEL